MGTVFIELHIVTPVEVRRKARHRGFQVVVAIWEDILDFHQCLGKIHIQAIQVCTQEVNHRAEKVCTNKGFTKDLACSEILSHRSNSLRYSTFEIYVNHCIYKYRNIIFFEGLLHINTRQKKVIGFFLHIFTMSCNQLDTLNEH